MVFLSIQEPIEEFIKHSEKSKLYGEWILFDRFISTKSLKAYHNVVNGGEYYLRNFMYQIFYYPFYYDKPLYCYLIENKYFYKLNLFKGEYGEYKDLSRLIRMKRVPEYIGAKEKYERIPLDKRLFCNSNDFNENMEYIENKFKKLVDCNLKECKINYIVFGESR